jgi:hypothetical protein
MDRICLPLIAFILVCGCDRSASPPKGEAPPSAAIAEPVPPSIPIEPSQPLSPPVAPPHPPTPNVRAADDLRSCPGMDIRRPKGTNCFGILPTACGADKAKPFIGRVADANTRKTVAAATGNASIRWIRPGEAIIENLLTDRLNIELDKQGRITKADCF